MSAALIILTIVAAVAGAVVGLFKGFTKSSFFGAAALVTLLIVRVAGTAAKKGSQSYGLAVILTAVIALLAVSAVLLALKKLLQRAVEARRKLSHYKNADDREENEAYILAAVDSGDRRQYRKHLRKGKKIRDRAGVWGVIDAVLGACSCALNALIATGTVICCFLLFVDLSNIGALYNLFSASLTSGAWQSTGASLALDLPLICTLSLTIRTGYKSGISSVLCLVVVLGMLVGFGYAAWSVASSSMCAGTVDALVNGALSKLSGVLGDKTEIVAKAIIAGIIFLLSLIVVILVGIFLPRLTDKFRENKVFSAVDGVIGAIVLCAVIVAILTAIGGVAYTLNDLAFMDKFNGYADASTLGDGMYAFNPFGSSFASLPLRKLFNTAS